MSAIKRLTHASILAAGLLLAVGKEALAEDNVSSIPTIPVIESGLTLQAIGSESGIIESNPLLLYNGAKTLTGSVTSPELILNDQTPLDQLRIDTRVDENQFDQSTFDSTDVHSNILLTRQNQRWMVGVTERTDYDTTRTSELTNFNNVNTVPIRHLGNSFAPEIAFSPTAVDKFMVQGNYSENTYESSTFTNYETASVTPSYAHNFDPRNAATFSVEAQTYKSTSGAASQTETITPQIGWVTDISTRLKGTATVGFQGTKQTQGASGSAANWTLSPVYSLDLGFTGQQDKFDLLTNRTEYPFGNGTEALLTTFSVTEVHSLNPAFSLNASFSYISGSYQATTVGSLDSGITANGGVTYHATQTLDANANYQYRSETLTNVPGSATDNIFTIGIVYHPMSWKL